MTEDEIVRFVSDGFERAKGGNAIDTYRQVLEIFNAGELPKRSHYPFGWIAYYALHQSATHEIEQRKRMLALYLRLSVARPHKLHSMILTEAIRLYKDARDMAYVAKGKDIPHFSIIKFSRLWDLDNLRPGDWRRKEHDGTLLNATAERLITIYVDELEQTSQTPTEDINALMERALTDFPNTDTLLAQQATLLRLAGEPLRARDMLRRAILNAPTKFFLWHRLATMMSPRNELRLHIAFLCKALLAPGPDKFKGRIHLDLAAALIACGQFPKALRELQSVESCYKENSWHLPRVFAELTAKIPDGVAPETDPGWYRRFNSIADHDIYSQLPSVKVVKTYHKDEVPPKPGSRRPTPIAWRLTDGQGNNYWIQPHRYNLRPDLKLGTKLLIKVHDGKAVAAELDKDFDGVSIPF